jgi:HD-GYP domain-containing protein (c-di-GMP phosphodiesterase class II)
VCYASSTDNLVAVADVFGALNSWRPYKEAWSTNEAVRELRKLADDKLDRDGVALIKHRAQVEEIRRYFRESPFA